jgi:phospholipase C
MLENRSFDHMLGFLKYDDTTKKINGLTGNETCYSAVEIPPEVQVSRDAGDVHDLNPDPSHDFDEVTQQIYSSGLAHVADMKGFVRSYNDVCQNPVHAGNVMKCFTPDTLPVLSTLAKSYGVCDRWFASVPGSTIPNRLFVHGASSCGSVNQDAIAAPFVLKTIYESMGAATVHDYRIYTSGASILLANRYLLRHQGKFASYDDTFEDDALDGHLPAYTFIEPAYDDDGNGLFASSQHPDFPVDRGESLIADIYNILVQSPQWPNMLFLILYDEHGGIYDHVVPPTLKPLPENAGLPPLAPAKNGFDFTRLGVRVPAVFISPRIKPGTIYNDRDFEHSSVVATVRKLFCAEGTQSLSWRDAQANTFENVLEIEGNDYRKDVVRLNPIITAAVDIKAAAELRKATDLSVLMAKAMDYSFKVTGLKPPGDITTLTTASEVSAFLQKSQNIVLKGRQ